jgi:TolB-like protein/predicted Ser/Thr protein kinase/predicted Zn-dependent protease
MPKLGAVHDGERGRDSPIMSSAPRVCRKCGAEIFADAPEGLCTACLFETGLNLLANESVAGVVDSGRQDHQRLLGKKKTARSPKSFADFGDYELLEVIGRGGQGVVYRARQKSLNRTVALKVIGLGHWATEAHLKRFRREAEAAASLDHSGIVPIYEVGERDGSCYFSMRLVEGGQLDEVVKRKPMPIRRAVELMAKVACTVHYAHEHGILHRDIKPGNILLDGKGEPHLTDFGLARLVETESTVTRTMEVLGTPSYMAPEQALGNNARVSSATDVYGLGAVLYQLLTGHPPFAGGTTYETIKLLLDTEPRQPRLLNPKLDRDLSTICVKCLEKDPKRRYSSALALAEDLERWLKHEPIRAKPSGFFTHGRKWVRRNPTTAVLIASLVALVAAVGAIVWKSELVRRPIPASIAVLPFENLSQDKENAFLADGVQDDVLTKLAKIADLKVISRTSVMQYRGQRNTRQIGEALRVSHVLEGSVRKTGGGLHMNAQLIDARTDTHVWAEDYDCNLDDVFAVQSEIARKVADYLHANLSVLEKKAINQKSTDDVLAYESYIRAKDAVESYADRDDQRRSLIEAIDLLNHATERDPGFALAYCYCARAHALIYFLGFDSTPARSALAEQAVNAALHLSPDLSEAHLAKADCYFRCHRDYERASAELARARPGLPNSASFFMLAGYIDRRRGRWDDSTRELEKAADLDPRNLNAVNFLGDQYRQLRRFDESKRWWLKQARQFPPHARLFEAFAAWMDFSATGHTTKFRAALQALPLEINPAAAITSVRVLIALTEHDYSEARRVLAASPLSEFQDIDYTFYYPRAWYEAQIARAQGDELKAREAWMAARQALEVKPQAHYDDPRTLAVLAQIDAGLGRKEQAISEGRRAVDLMPISKDAYDGSLVLMGLAQVYVWTAEKERAMEVLETLVRFPGYVAYGYLLRDPIWDPLRGDQRFEQILASLAPKELASE